MVWSGGSTSRRFGMPLASRSALLAGCLVVNTVLAGDVVELNVTDSRGVYSIDVMMRVHAPAAAVWQVLTDFTHIYRLNASITESEILPPPDETVMRVRTVVNDCVFVFCFDIERVEDVRNTDAGELVANVVTELSNIKSGTARWRILPDGNESYISYQGTIEPGFAVFPIIGDYLARLKLREETLLTLENIERISRIEAGLDVDQESGIAASVR